MLGASAYGQNWNQIIELAAADGADNNTFGNSVSVSGDYALVGAGNNNGTGAAYVFVRSATGWTQQAKLTATDGVAGDGFGSTVTLSGEYALVGAPSSTSTGAAYVFVRSATGWTQQAKLTPPGTTTATFGFGIGLAISNDYALVGDANRDQTTGAAYVYTRSGTTWTQQAMLTASDGFSGNGFGFSASLSGDYALIGTLGSRGGAYVFVRSGSTWTQQAMLSEGATGNSFGVSVSLSGDYALIGADGQNNRTGAAYIFQRMGTTWAQRAMLTASDATTQSGFGRQVSLSGAYALVGAPTKDSNTGAAYVFARSGSSWSQQSRLTASDGAAGDNFSLGASLSGNYALLGAGGKNNARGAAYVFSPCDVAITTQPPSGSSVAAGSSVSAPVSVSGNVSSYQWYKDNLASAVSGQTSATLTLSNVQPSDAGSYSLVAANACTSLTSTAFSLSVTNPKPTMAGFRATLSSACAGTVVSFTATVGNLVGAYSFTLTNGSSPALTGTSTDPAFRQSLTASGSGSQSFTLTLSANGGQRLSATTAVIVNPRPAAPYATSIPRQLYTTNFPVPLLLYALPTSWNTELGFYQSAANTELKPAVIQPTQPGVFSYYATQTDAKGCVSVPTPISLTVLAGGTLVSRPTDQTVCANTSTTLSVSVSGGGSNPRYSWYEADPASPYQVDEVGSGTKGGNSASLTISKVSKTRLYYCLVIGQYNIGVAGPIRVTVRTGCGARLAVEEPGLESGLQVKLLGNPVVDGQLRVELRGVTGQPVDLQLVDQSGRSLGTTHIEQAGEVETQTLSVSPAWGSMLLLKASSGRQQQSLKVVQGRYQN